MTGISCNKRIVGNIPPDHGGIFGTTILKGAQDEKESSDTTVYSRCCRYACGRLLWNDVSAEASR